MPVARPDVFFIQAPFYNTDSAFFTHIHCTFVFSGCLLSFV